MSLFTENKDLLIGIFSGLIASALFAFLIELLRFIKTYLYNKKIVNVWKKSKIDFIFDTQDKCEEQMYEDFKNSNIALFFCTRAAFFIESSTKFNELLRIKNGDIRFILLNPDSPYVDKRQRELNEVVTSERIQLSIEALNELQKHNNNIKLALHDEFLRVKFYIFEEAMYLGFRLKAGMSTNGQMYRIKKESNLYKAFFQQFSDYWEKYRGVSSEIK